MWHYKLMTEIEQIEAYHGTNEQNERKILTNNFIESIGDREWYGDGVYFFVNDDYIDGAEEHARKWAIASAYNKKNKNYNFNKYVVLKAVVKLDYTKLFDLDKPEYVKLFNDFLESIKDEIIKNKKNFGQNITGTVLNLIFKKSNIEFVKQRPYLKFTKERKVQIRTSVPNVCVLTVRNPQNNIDTDSITTTIKDKIL